MERAAPQGPGTGTGTRSGGPNPHRVAPADPARGPGDVYGGRTPEAPGCPGTRKDPDHGCLHRHRQRGAVPLRDHRRLGGDGGILPLRPPPDRRRRGHGHPPHARLPRLPGAGDRISWCAARCSTSATAAASSSPSALTSRGGSTDIPTSTTSSSARSTWTEARHRPLPPSPPFAAPARTRPGVLALCLPTAPRPPARVPTMEARAPPGAPGEGHQ